MNVSHFLIFFLLNFKITFTLKLVSRLGSVFFKEFTSRDILIYHHQNLLALFLNRSNPEVLSVNIKHTHVHTYIEEICT